MENQTISAVLIVKNEENTISNCLHHLISKVNEIILCDTGSIDNTLELVRQLNSRKIKICHYRWKDDFSGARNYAWSQATEQWILWIDADEYLQTTAKSLYKQINRISASNINVADIKIYDQTQNNFSWVPRVVKNDPLNFKFHGLIHEELVLRGEGAIPVDSCFLDIVLNHSGYDQATIRSKNKIKRNVNLLLKMHNIEKNNPRWDYFLTRDGISVLSNSYLIHVGLEGIRLNNVNYQIGLYENIIKLFLKTGDYITAEEYNSRLKAEYPNCMDYIYFYYLIKIHKTRMCNDSELLRLINLRKSFVNKDQYYSLINMRGLHIDSIIEFMLFSLRKYEYAKRFHFYLESNEYPSLLNKEQRRYLFNH